jgi:AraC family transcriptional regulator
MRIDSAGIQYGTVLQTRDAGRFRLRESRYPAHLVTPVHDHAEPYFSYVVRGAMSERCRRRDEVLYPGRSFHSHPSADPHHAWMGPQGATVLSITPRGRVALRIDAAWRSEATREAARLAGMARRCHEELHATDAASDLALEALCLELVAAWMRSKEDAPESTPPRWLREARDVLHDHADRPIAMTELAAHAGVHPSHLARSFRRHLGCSPGAYLRRLRLERACEALAETRESILAIALEAGFSGQAHFTRAFHRTMGLPPGAYRKLHGRLR